MFDSMCRSAYAMSYGTVEIVVYADDDDPWQYLWSGLNVIRGPRRPLMDAWNVCAEHARGDILMHAGDDLVFRTPGWDRKVCEAFDEFEDRILFAFANDGSPVHGDSFGTHGFVSRRWVDTLGYLVPPYFTSDFNDVWLNELAEVVGRKRYLRGVLIEHMHPLWGKRAWDQTDLERLSRHAEQNPAQVYAELAGKRAEDVGKLRAAMGRVAA